MEASGTFSRKSSPGYGQACAADALMERMAGEMGAVYQDGGTPVAGIARILDPDDWDKLVKEFLLTEETVKRYRETRP